MYDFMNYIFFKGIGGGGATTQNTCIMHESIYKCLVLYDFLFLNISIATLTNSHYH